MEFEAGEEITLEIGDYTFSFSGPVSLTKRDIERLRRAAENADNAEQRIQRRKKSRKVGFE